MGNNLEPSKGLAIEGQKAPTILIPPPKPKRVRVRKVNEVVAQRRLTLKERAEALAEKKKPQYRHLIHLSEDEEDAFLSICERQVVEPGLMALHLFRDGMRRFRGLPKLESGLLDEETIDAGSLGDHVPEAFNRFGHAYRETVRQEQAPPEGEQMKALAKSLGVQTT